MSEQPRRPAVIVGVFVTVGIVLLSGGVLAIGDLNDSFSRKITVSTVFDEVNGLKAGDSVWFSGVKVGRVQTLTLEAGSRVGVEMKVDRAAAAFIREDALAKIGSEGAIGSKLVVLYDGTPGRGQLEDGDVLVAGEGLSMDDMMATFQANNENLLAITSDLRVLTGGLVAGDGVAGRLLSDELLGIQMVDTVTSLQEASVEAQSVTANLSTFTGKLNRPGTLPHDLVTNEALVPSLTATAAKLDAVADSVARSTADTNTAVGALLNDAQAGADMKETLANLKEGSALLNEDLEAAQHSFPLRGGFRRKAKAAAADVNQVGRRP